jgi:Kef-type K+ transport system membrane component KefB
METVLFQTIFGIVFLVIIAKIAGKLCSKIGISEIIGYILVGMVLGSNVLVETLPFITMPFSENEMIESAWMVSGIVILFSAGLHFTFADLKRVGYRAVIIGVTGLLVPLFCGFSIANLLGYDWVVALIIGGASSPTSIAITFSVLKKINKINTFEGKTAVNSALIDDVLGLAMLSTIVTAMTLQTIPNVVSLSSLLVTQVGFWFALLLGAVFFLPRIMRFFEKYRRDSLKIKTASKTVALSSAFSFSAIAVALGLNPILGSFAAGMGIAESKSFIVQIKNFVSKLNLVFIPLFFAYIGTLVDPMSILTINPIMFVILFVIAILSKFGGCGIISSILLKNKLKGFQIGATMIPRGEIAFIIIGTALTIGILNAEIYSTLVFVTLGTILISPRIIRLMFKKT